jgi:1,4-dihydroxy-2-naphthoate octaprenyltransferase
MKMKHSIKEWLIAVRPWSFPASAMPVLTTLCYLQWSDNAKVNWFTGVWALINIIIFHAAGNTWSDYFDYKRGVDTTQTAGATTLTSGMFRPKEIRTLSISLLILALIGGIGLMLITDWSLLWYGVGGALCVLLYPYMKFRALGDIVIAIAYAWLPCWGTSHVATGEVDVYTLLLALPLGCITVAILHCNNTRDVHTDGNAHIRTFAMKIGHSRASVLYQFYMFFPFVCVATCIVLGLFPYLTLLAFVALPNACKNASLMRRCQIEDTSVIARLDERTAQLQLIFSLLISISFIISSIWL